MNTASILATERAELDRSYIKDDHLGQGEAVSRENYEHTSEIGLNSGREFLLCP
jgi:hypothetical protein